MNKQLLNRLDNNNDYSMLDLQNAWFDVLRSRSQWLKYSYISLGGYKRPAKRLSLNIGKVACAELSNLLFSETPQLNASQSVLDILKANKFLKNTKLLSEYIAALGGGAFKLRSDGEKISIDFVKAYNVIPVSWDNGGVYEADFLSKKTINDKEYKIIEQHRKAYRNLPLQSEDGTMELDKKGLPVLSDESTYIGYSIVTKMYFRDKLVELPEGMIEEQILDMKTPPFAYMRTSLANNFLPDSPVGISYYANALDTIQALDIAFNGLNDEILLGKKRIFVPTSAMRYAIDPVSKKRSRYFDPDDKVYCALSVDDDEALDIKDDTQELRIEEIKTAIQTLLDIFCMQVGFSAGFLAFDGDSVKTATEVISNNSKTFKTKTAFESEISDGMVSIMNAISELLGVSEECSVTFDDSVIEDRNSKKDYWIDLVTAGLATKKRALMKIYGISEKEAIEMLAEIEAETPQPLNFGI